MRQLWDGPVGVPLRGDIVRRLFPLSFIFEALIAREDIKKQFVNRKGKAASRCDPSLLCPVAHPLGA